MMLPVIASVGLFLALMLGITLFGYRRYARPGKIYEQLGAPVAAAPDDLLSGEAAVDRPAVRVLRRIGGYIPVSPGDASYIRRALIAAGYRTEGTATVFYGLKVLGAVLMLGLALLMQDALAKSGVMRVVMLVGSAVAGYCLPGFLLNKKITRRQETLRLSLPDALDLMVVSVEAGLGLDQAIQHVSRELRSSHPEISEEWSLVNLEMRAGKRRADALRNLAERTGEPELRKLVAILVQNDRFGTSMAESLRTHSDFMRTRRRQDAEERAGKVGVKLIFPIFFFILPSMMVVTAGPAMLQIFKYLFPLMAGAAGTK